MPLVLENGTVIPPANLTDLPYCLDFQVKDLPAHLRPQRIKVAKADSGPFLFTPIHFNSVDRRDKKKDKNKIGKLVRYMKYSPYQAPYCSFPVGAK